MSSQPAHKYGVLFYLFAGRARPVILDFTEDNDGDQFANKDKQTTEDDGEYDLDAFEDAPNEASTKQQLSTNTNNVKAKPPIHNTTSAASPPHSRNNNVIRFTNTFPKLPILKAPRSAQYELLKNDDAAVRKDDENLKSTVHFDQSTATTTVVADDTMRSLQKVILYDVIRRAMETLSAPSKLQLKNSLPSMNEKEIISAMAGKDITLLAMAASRDCRARAYTTAASQKKVNPHKQLSNSSVSAQHNTTNSTTAHLQKGQSVAKSNNVRLHSKAATESFSRGFISDGYVPEYMRSLRRVIVSSNSKITTHGYKPAYTNMNASLNAAHNRSTNSFANMSQNNGSSIAAGGMGSSRLRQQFGADSGVFTTANTLIDPSNPNLMLCDSFETLLKHVSPFCFGVLDEVHFKIRPSAAKGQHKMPVVEEGENVLGSSTTIPPMLLFAASGAKGFGTSASASKGVKGDKATTINTNDLDPDAVTVRGYPVLMNQQDAFGLYTFIHYSNAKGKNNMSANNPYHHHAASEREDRSLSPSRPMSGVAGIASTTEASISKLRADESIPTHPRNFISAEVHVLLKGEDNKNQSYFSSRPMCPLQLHMEWLSGTRLWVPHEGKINHRDAKKKQKVSSPLKASALSQPQQQNVNEENAIQTSVIVAPHPQEDIYDEHPVGPLAPIMHPPPPLTFAPKTTLSPENKTEGSKVLASPLRRKGQELLLTANCALPLSPKSPNVKSNLGSPSTHQSLETAQDVSSTGANAPADPGVAESKVDVSPSTKEEQPLGIGANLGTANSEQPPPPTQTSMSDVPTNQSVPPLALTELSNKQLSPRPLTAHATTKTNTTGNSQPQRLTARPPTAPSNGHRNKFAASSSHPLLRLLLQQRIQDHLDYLTTQEECYRRQVIWRSQLEARQIILLSFVKELEEISGMATQLNDVLFVQKQQHSELRSQLRREAQSNPRQRTALIEASPLVRKLRGML